MRSWTDAHRTDGEAPTRARRDAKRVGLALPGRRGRLPARLAALVIGCLLVCLAGTLAPGQAAPARMYAAGSSFWDYKAATESEIRDAMYHMWYGTDPGTGYQCALFMDRWMDHGGYCWWYSDGRQLQARYTLGSLIEGDA